MKLKKKLKSASMNISKVSKKNLKHKSLQILFTKAMKKWSHSQITTAIQDNPWPLNHK